MINPDLVGGLKSALARGYPLEEAMRSFLNGGYKEEEIEEAAHVLQAKAAQSPGLEELFPQPIWKAKEKSVQPTSISQPARKIVARQIQPRVVTQGVAAYTSYDDSKIRLATIILIILLIVLLGVLGAMYLFKNQIIDFLNSLF